MDMGQKPLAERDKKHWHNDGPRRTKTLQALLALVVELEGMISSDVNKGHHRW